VGLVGFVVMLASAVVLVQSLRKLVQDRWGPGGAPDEAGGPSGRGRPPWAFQPWLRPGGRPGGGKWWRGTGGGGRKDDDPR
jgi:hypothetical protein